ncbi:hypothetical protein KSC_036060 [Ktedonobacter sp. SOSP1-52]|nr:hypothetical protein KSC_036060 [Ktedonobacter sp. SOSP1-52]
MIEIANEIVALLQPKFFSSGTIRTLGVERIPADARRARNVMTAINQP